MRLNNEVRKELEDLYLKTPENIHSVSFGMKRKNDARTSDPAIVFYVTEKKPLSSLSPNEVLPSEISIDGQIYKTDVVQMPTASFHACYINESETPGSSYFSSNANITRLQGFNTNVLLPMRGGQLLSQYPSGWLCQNGNCSIPGFGTLGGFCVDNVDNKIVGVTNTHVIINNFFRASSSNITQQNADPYNTYELDTWSLDGQSYRPGVRAFSSLSNSAINIYTRLPLVGQLKRHIGYLSTGINYSDVAIFHPNPSVISADSSFKVWQPIGQAEYTFPYAFASTAEINNLLSTDPKLYATGITSGPKGYSNISCTTTSTSSTTSSTSSTSSTTSTTCAPDTTCCILRVAAIGATADINSGFGLVTFGDLIVYEYEDNSFAKCPSFPSAPGDSGSFVIADFGAQGRKIIGINFAGNGYIGLACRIDRVAAEINIRAWDGSFNTSPLPVTTSNLLTTSYSGPYASQSTLSYGGRVYYQAGFTKTAGLPYIV